MSDWRDWETGPRRAAKDGIKARSTRGEIGETWWSQRFIAALKEVADASRLSRGRSYARSGPGDGPARAARLGDGKGAGLGGRARTR